MSQPSISRENIHQLTNAEGDFHVLPEPTFDKKGNQYLFADDAATADAHSAAEEGKWEKFAQPGFEDSAKSIALVAQKETAHDDANWEDYQRWLEEKYAASDADLAAGHIAVDATVDHGQQIPVRVDSAH